MEEVYVCGMCGIEYNTMEQADSCCNNSFCGELYYRLENGKIINPEIMRDMGLSTEWWIKMITINPGHCKIVYIISKKFPWRKKKAEIVNNNGVIEICGLNRHEILAEDVQDVTPDPLVKDGVATFFDSELLRRIQKIDVSEGRITKDGISWKEIYLKIKDLE